MSIKRIICILAIISMWLITGVTYAQTSTPKDNADSATSTSYTEAPRRRTIYYNDISVPLSLYVTSLIATVITVWKIAQYDKANSNEISQMRTEFSKALKNLSERFDTLEEEIEEYKKHIDKSDD